MVAGAAPRPRNRQGHLRFRKSFFPIKIFFFLFFFAFFLYFFFYCAAPAAMGGADRSLHRIGRHTAGEEHKYMCYWLRNGSSLRGENKLSALLLRLTRSAVRINWVLCAVEPDCVCIIAPVCRQQNKPNSSEPSLVITERAPRTVDAGFENRQTYFSHTVFARFCTGRFAFGITQTRMQRETKLAGSASG
jgi:hypothetical protein